MYETLTHEVVISLTSSSQLKWIQSEDMTIGLVVSYAVCLFLPMRYCFFSSEMKDFLLVLLSSHVLGTHAGAKLQLSQFQSPTTESFDSNSGTRYCCYGFWQGRSECIWSLDITGWKILENQSITSPNTPNTLAGMFDPCFWPKDSPVVPTDYHLHKASSWNRAFGASQESQSCWMNFLPKVFWEPVTSILVKDKMVESTKAMVFMELILMQMAKCHVFQHQKISSCCFLNPKSASGFFLIEDVCLKSFTSKGRFFSGFCSLRWTIIVHRADGHWGHEEEAPKTKWPTPSHCANGLKNAKVTVSSGMPFWIMITCDTLKVHHFVKNNAHVQVK